ncbi:MAG TPA: hypothetical protein VFH43_03255, partial [Candidatus Kapabacteria bacterium]|nr:hypothetical protein [Candidatus Kapabacteria bacterium]
MVRLLLFSISFLLSLTALQDADAQIAVNAGRKFAFGIPEGPDRQVDSTQRVSRLFLTFMG